MAAFRISQFSKHLIHHTKGNLKNSRIASCTTSSKKAEDVLATRKNIDVLDSYISYLDTAVGDETVLFLHGNPTSSYLWRNVIPHVQPIARCLAPDLIGMGKSGKEPNNNYRFVDHYKYLSAWIEKMNLPKKVHLVIHDWGSGLGFHWSNMNRDRVGSITYLEALVAPMKDWSQFPEQTRDFFQALRSPQGEDMVLKKNLFVKLLLPNAILRKLSEEEMDYYLSPYKEEGESRRPTLTWPREIPVISDGPADVVKFSTEYSQWLATAENIPKLYIHVEPGFFSEGIQKVVKTWPNNQIVTVKGHHFAQEDSPDEIGQALNVFIQSLN